MAVDIFLGLLGVVIGAGIFIAGFVLGRKSVIPPTPPAAPAHTYTAAEEAEMLKERERLREEQDAFHQLLSYNRNLAYGIEPERGSGM